MVGFEQRNPHHIYDVWTHTAHAVQAVPADPVLRLTMLLHDVAKPATFSVDDKGKGHFYGHPEKSAVMAKKILLRLKSDMATLENVVTLVRVHDHTFPTTRPGMRRFIGRLGMPIIEQLFEVKKADQAAQSDHEQEKKRAELRAAALLIEDLLDEPPAFTVKDLAIGGRELIALGIKPSPAMGELLERLLAEVQDEKLENTREALTLRVQHLLRSIS
jgi:tRNA nucleotidyltransferase (CCA-adding enzyme)